jgi:hypothetical protein
VHKEDGHCTYNVKFRRVRLNIVTVGKATMPSLGFVDLHVLPPFSFGVLQLMLPEAPQP